MATPEAEEPAGRQRRRGDLLENALLDAAWDELVQSGYDEFRVDAVASRAQTSRPVLYRRWPNKPSLVLAAIRHASAKTPFRVPNTGSLRGDIIGLLQQANETRMQIAALIVLRLGSYYRDTSSGPADVQAALGPFQSRIVDRIIARAVERGEIPPGLPQRILDLPFDLFRQQIVVTSRPVPTADIQEIVDEIFLPLVRARISEVGESRRG